MVTDGALLCYLSNLAESALPAHSTQCYPYIARKLDAKEFQIRKVLLFPENSRKGLRINIPRNLMKLLLTTELGKFNRSPFQGTHMVGL